MSSKDDPNKVSVNRNSKEELLYEGKFVRMKRFTFQRGENAKIQTWEGVERTTRTGKLDAVCMTVIVKAKGHPNRIMLVKQYRPPTCRSTIEFPAGLIDEGESPQESALRELKEETGYVGKVISQSHEILPDPALNGANFAMVHVEVDLDDPENQKPVQDEEDAYISVELVEVKKLLPTLKDYAARNFAIDANVFYFASGLENSDRFL